MPPWMMTSNYIFHPAEDLCKLSNPSSRQTLSVNVRAVDHQTVLNADKIRNHRHRTGRGPNNHSDRIAVPFQDFHPGRCILFRCRHGMPLHLAVDQKYAVAHDLLFTVGIAEPDVEA